jgi:glycosyltransferase involved in cell wall biosynthesis
VSSRPGAPRGLAKGDLTAVLTAEQLLGPVPGGIGRYVGALASHLPPVAGARGGTVRFVTGRHAPERLAEVGLDPAVTTTMGLPGRVLNQTWVRARRPRLPAAVLAGAEVIHATSAAVPPAGGLPLVVTVHDLAFHQHPEAYPRAGRDWHERSTRIAVAEAALLVTPSSATARDLSDLYGVEPARIAVVPLGVGPSPSDQAAARRLLDELDVKGPFLLAVGTLEPRKNLRRLLNAFATLADELPDHHLVVVGPAGWGPRLPQPAEYPGQAVRIRLAGKVRDPVLHGLYELADALAYPSLYEGFGLPVLEAMAHGTPVLTSDRSSLPEVAGDAAVLVDPISTESIATGLRSLVGDEALRARLRAAGPERAARFTWEATAEATWTVYRRAAA